MKVVYLPATTNWKKLAVDLIEACGYGVIIVGGKKPGHPPKQIAGIFLPTGVVLKRSVELVMEDLKKEKKEGNPEPKITTALSRLLEDTVGYTLRERGTPESKIKAAIERQLPILKRRYREARNPRGRRK
jgi:hypothetical protein